MRDVVFEDVEGVEEGEDVYYFLLETAPDVVVKRNMWVLGLL